MARATLLCALLAVFGSQFALTNWDFRAWLPRPLAERLPPAADSPSFLVLLPFVAAVTLLVWQVKWAWFVSPLVRPHTRAALRRHQCTAELALLLAMLAYLYTAVAALPLRRQAERDLQQYLRVGEVPMLAGVAVTPGGVGSR